MGRTPRAISDTELDVLKALWAAGEATVRDLLERLNAEGRDWAYTTVQTLLVRLQQKGYVTSAKTARAHVFRAEVSREELIRLELGDLASRVCDGSTTPLVLSLVQDNRFSPDEIQALRALLDDLEKEPRGRRRD